MDERAEPGSIAWAQTVRLRLLSAVADLPNAPEITKEWIDALHAHHGWRLLHRRDGEPFRSFDEFCEYARPWGLGTPFAEIQPFLEAALGKKRAALAMLPAARQGERTDLKELELTSRHDGGKSKRVEQRLRAILRAPQIVRTLYENDLISQVLAAKLGPKKPTLEQEVKIGEIVKEIGLLTDRREIDDTVREMLGIAKSPYLRALKVVRSLDPEQRAKLLDSMGMRGE